MKSWADLIQWLEADGPADMADAARTTLAYFYSPHREGGSATAPSQQAFSALRSHWLTRHPEIGPDDLWQIVEAETLAIEKGRQEAKANRQLEAHQNSTARALERQRQQEREEALKRERQERAEAVKKVADGLGCTLRYAQKLIRDGTTDRARAEQLAAILGTSWAVHHRRRSKPGRAPDLVARFLRLSPESASFADFTHDATDLHGTAAQAVSRLYSVADECSRLEPLLAHARERGVDPEAAMLLWLRYKRWRVTVIADRAAEQADEELERFLDFG